MTSVQQEDDDLKTLESLTYDSFLGGQSLCSLCSDPRVWRPSGQLSSSASARQSVETAAAASAAALNVAREQSEAQLQSYVSTVTCAVDLYSPERTGGEQDREMTEEEIAKTLEEVPKDLFEENFDMWANNGAMFQMLCGFDGKKTQDEAGQDLSRWLDAVELTIIQEISSKSASFFESLDAFEQLRDEVIHVVDEAGTVKNELADVDENSIVPTVLLGVRSRRRDNLLAVQDKLGLISAVVKAEPAVARLVKQLDYCAAMDVIDRSRAVLKNQLVGVRALEGHKKVLDEAEQALSSSIHDAFLKIALNSDSDQLIEESCQASLRSVISAEKRMRTLLDVLVTFEETMAKRGSMFLRLVTDMFYAENPEVSKPEVLDSPESFNSALKQIVSDMTQPLFFSFIQSLFRDMQQATLRACGVHDAISAMCADDPSQRGVKERSNQMLLNTYKIYHDSASKVFRSRRGFSQVIIEELATLYNKVDEVCTQEEAKLQKRLPVSWVSPIRESIDKHMKHFVDSFHSREQKKIRILLDSENWTLATVSDEEQSVVDQLTGETSSAGRSEKRVVVGTHVFKTIGSFLVLCKALVGYLKVPSLLPVVAPEIASKIADLLYVFHRRIHQLILGAEVTKILGLKSIPAKTLALCSQVLYAIMELIPYIRASLHPYMNSPKHFANLQLLDNASDDINVHIHQIFEKFASIITERLQAHMGDSEAYQQTLLKQKDQQQECSPPMERFLKELCSLHRVLDQYLSPEQMEEVFKLVSNNIGHGYCEILTKCDATNEDVVNMAELDAMKLCNTAEGLKNSSMKLTDIQNRVAEMKKQTAKRVAPVVEEPQPEEPVTSMTVEDGSDDDGVKDDNSEEKHQSEQESPQDEQNTVQVEETQQEENQPQEENPQGSDSVEENTPQEVNPQDSVVDS